MKHRLVTYVSTGRRRISMRRFLSRPSLVSFPQQPPSVALLAFGGCRARRVIEPVRIANGRVAAMTIAVAPALNLSGSRDFDPNTFADLMASELGYAEGIEVIPVNVPLSPMNRTSVFFRIPRSSSLETTLPTILSV